MILIAFSSTGRDSSFIVAAWLAQGFEEGSVLSFSFFLGLRARV